MIKEWRPSAHCVETAESARQAGHIVLAAEAAAGGMGQPSPIAGGQWLTSDRIDEFLGDKDPTRMLILVTLARIHVDTNKTLANRALTPKGAVHRLEQSVHTINLVYRHPSLQEALQLHDTDHRGRPNDFVVEMPRDIAKVAFAAGDVLKPSQGSAVILMGEKLLIQTHDSLPKEHPTKSLLWIELQLSQALRDRPIDTARMLDDFHTLVGRSQNNPHRVATVASWLVARAAKDENEELYLHALKVFERQLRNNPGWKGMVAQERRKLAMIPIRRVLFQAAAQVCVPTRRREQLYNSIVGK